MTLALNRSDAAVRVALYRFIVRRGHVPAVRELARSLSRPDASVRRSFHRLADAHALVLQEGSDEILRAAPFWAVPTAFRVESGKQSWWGSCIWDALGIPAMLGRDARIVTGCGCCDSAMTLHVRRGKLQPAEGVIHFAVPASRWYENIVFT